MSSHSESKLWITSESLMSGFFNKYFFPVPLRLLAIQHCLTECSSMSLRCSSSPLTPILKLWCLDFLGITRCQRFQTWKRDSYSFLRRSLNGLLMATSKAQVPHCARGKDDPVPTPTSDRNCTPAAARLAAIAERLSSDSEMLTFEKEKCFLGSRRFVSRKWEHTTHTVVSLALSVKRPVHGERDPQQGRYSCPVLSRDQVLWSHWAHAVISLSSGFFYFVGQISTLNVGQETATTKTSVHTLQASS